MTERQVCSPEELRTLFLFEKLTDSQLAWLCERGRVEKFAPGPVYTEGDPASCLYVMLSGTVVTSRKVGADEVELNRTSWRGAYAGAFFAFFGDKVPQVYVNSMRAAEETTFFVISSENFSELVNDWFPMAVHLLEAMYLGQRSMMMAVGRREHLLALGSLSAGLTHELNNPASAAVSATAALRERVAGMRHKLGLLSYAKFTPDTLQALVRLQEEAAERVPKAVKLDPLETSDREDSITDWLDERNVTDGWQLAPTYVQANIDIDFLEHVAATVDETALEPAMRWLYYTVETELLMNEIQDATSRVSNLVNAARQYSQLDRAPFQVVDVHELLDSTLMMLAGKFPPGITVARQYDRSLPHIPGYPAELNQVWTNLIDNAVAAMGDSGRLTVRTGMDGDHVFVEFADTGPGVPAELQVRIFEPFFTTKPPGQGTGLGLDISWRIVVNKHHGDLTVESSPGDTRFRVRLPLTASAPSPDPE